MCVEAMGKELKGHSLHGERDLAATGMESAQAALQLRTDKCWEGNWYFASTNEITKKN